MSRNSIPSGGSRESKKKNIQLRKYGTNATINKKRNMSVNMKSTAVCQGGHSDFVGGISVNFTNSVREENR